MGSPKALLRIGNKSFVRHLVDVYDASNVDRTVVVVAPNAHEIEIELKGSPASIVVNRAHEDGQLSSIVAGIEAAETIHADAVFIHPVDHPLISPGLINSLIAAYHPPGHLVVVPVFNGKRGHPVLISALLFDMLKNAPRDVGARAVIRANERFVAEVATDERGVILDIDTPEDYEHLKGNLSVIGG